MKILKDLNLMEQMLKYWLESGKVMLKCVQDGPLFGYKCDCFQAWEQLIPLLMSKFPIDEFSFNKLTYHIFQFVDSYCMAFNAANLSVYFHILLEHIPCYFKKYRCLYPYCQFVIERKVGETKRVKKQKASIGNNPHKNIVQYNERSLLFLAKREETDRKHSRDLYKCSKCG